MSDFPPETEDAGADWVVLEPSDNWGQMRYRLPGESRERAILAFVEGQHYRTRWPDGSELSLPCVLRKEFGRMSDHGKDYDVLRERVGFEVVVFGLKLWVSVLQLEVSRSEMFSRKLPP